MDLRIWKKKKKKNFGEKYLANLILILILEKEWTFLVAKLANVLFASRENKAIINSLSF